MNTIEVDKYRFLEVSSNPNIIISLKGEKNFCELSQKDKSNFLKSNFKLSSYSEFNQIHSVKNVFVTDGACMTSAGNQNPSITYMALTARAADHAVNELNRQNI